MSDIEADLRRAASSYWAAIAKKGGAERAAALLKARQALRESRAASAAPGGAMQPMIANLDAPVKEVVRAHRRKR
jgi:hypothetical protein